MTAGDSRRQTQNNGLRRLRSAGLVLVPGVAAVALLAWSPALSVARAAHDDPPWQAPRREPSPRSSPRAPRYDPIELGTVAWSTWWTAKPPGPGGSASPPSASSARVVPLRLEPDGTMQTPDDFAETGWFEPGREPGERGPAVIVGHVDAAGGPGGLLPAARAPAGRLDPDSARGRQRGSLPSRGPGAVAEGDLPDRPRIRQHAHGDAAASDLLGGLRSPRPATTWTTRSCTRRGRASGCGLGR